MPIVAEDFPESITIPSATLRKFTGARVDPYTRYVAYVLFRDLNISVHGQRNINNALSNLPVYQSTAPDNRLSFGWGLTSVIRDKAVHEGSYEHLAMMIALGESFRESYGAKVLTELASAAASPEDVTPHFSQWKAAIHACNGGFATTDFGLLVEEYLRIDPYPIRNVQSVESLLPPKLVADALQALMRVTAGHERAVTLTGSAVISWFGAVAEWLCGLRIAVYQANGVQLHITHPEQDAQLTLVYVQEPGIQFSFKPFAPHEVTVAKLTLVDQTYSSAVHATPFGGRVAWQSLLPRVFGKSFHYLDHEESKAFGLMIGSAARMFEGLALGKGDEEHNALVSTQNRSNTASYGAGLVETITNWLPELRRFQGRMERPLKMSYQDAAASYVEHLGQIRKACHCGICTSREELEKDQEGIPPPHGYCLAVLVETIISLGLCLSRMTVSAQLYPARSGILSFYVSQVSKRLEARGLHWNEHFKIVYGNEWNALDARRLLNAVQIFAGSRPDRDVPDNLVGLSHEGTCAYFVALEKSSKPGPEQQQVQLIRVVSGAMNVHEKVFDRACLGPVEDADPDDPWEEISYEHLATTLYCK
ncbi:hypothetical protein A1O1_03745 [Capronia coronata CBS 617.96]|uniref:Uncharacterized protein n=1 Tax=Capronia coronata CBS 617.96 TaxID=1182541 RepID=W9YN25_9EURO|nr:uncharacterized protein A1O1_03745 [Capronia coronata CBS 617.96]EXJ90641.1 hypothetical protein A1O1_03745 [Capronia coronata CBS 617.96]